MSAKTTFEFQIIPQERSAGMPGDGSKFACAVVVTQGKCVWASQPVGLAAQTMAEARREVELKGDLWKDQMVGLIPGVAEEDAE